MHVKSLVLTKMVIFKNISRKKSDQNIHQNTPFFTILSKVHTPEPLCHAIYTLMKKISAPLC